MSNARATLERQTRIGLLLAIGIITAWIVLHAGLVFFWPVQPDTILWAVPLIALQTWLSVGLFIVAHDCMHGSLVPDQPRWNRLIGSACLFLYAGFSFDALNVEHHKHHRHPGSADDPDFDDGPPHAFVPWFLKFFRHYFGWRQFGTILAVAALYFFALGASAVNMIVFWALPGLLSALQLFTFGTYLPHRPTAEAFVDRHNARTNEFPLWLSLLTCFHFGLHHEHHLHPSVPWWKLPAVRRSQIAAASPKLEPR